MKNLFAKKENPQRLPELELKKIPLDNIKFAEYQREVKPSKVNKIIKNFVPDILGIGLVSFRAGDFWGIENIKPHLDDDKGTSLVITNSNKGRELFEKIANKVRFEEVNLDEAIKYNLAMIKSVSKHKNREKFFKDIDKMEFDKLMKKYINSLKDFKRFLSRVKRKVLKLLGK